ncbi:MAG: hypothetical protein J6B01_04470 [Ruminococcus sp.]|nr:hypothetical protein [Ruminococcus sp.]
MSEIKANGAPTRNTKGAVGDIYIDSATGTKYKCTGAYMNGDQIDCDWKKVVDITKKPGMKQPKEIKPHDSSLVKPAETKETTKKAEEPKPEKTEEVKEKVEESKPIKNGKGNKQHNYGQHYNNNK